MAISAYSKYRLMVTKSSSGTAGYVAINEFGLYETADHSGANLCTGATATASGIYDASRAAAKAIDGNAGTFWESNNTSLPKWLQVDLAGAVEVRSMYLSSTTYINEVPRDFSLQGSNDGAAWDTIINFVDWVSTGVAKSAYEQLNVRVGGISQLDTGVSSTRVLVYDWATAAFLVSVVPASDGSWSCSLRLPNDLLITHIGPSGFQPWSDGPVTPKLE